MKAVATDSVVFGILHYSDALRGAKVVSISTVQNTRKFLDIDRCVVFRAFECEQMCLWVSYRLREPHVFEGRNMRMLARCPQNVHQRVAPWLSHQGFAVSCYPVPPRQ